MGEIEESIARWVVVAGQQLIADRAFRDFIQEWATPLIFLFVMLSISWLAWKLSLKFPPKEVQKPKNAYRNRWVGWRGSLTKYKIDAPPALRIPLLASVGALLVAAFGNVPYDFFVLLRVLVFLTCIGVIATLWNDGRDSSWFWIMLATGLMYNPLLPIHLHRATWELINLATVPFLSLFCFLIWPSRKTL